MAKARSYSSPRRDEQAEQTRQQILASARRLFSEAGYAATSISEIAEAAGVSVPTVYASVGSKPHLALSLVGFINAEVDMDSLVDAQVQASTPLDLLKANAHLARVLNERCGDIIRALLSAAASSPDLLPVLTEGRRVHREGCYAVAARLDSMGALAEHVDAAFAGAVLTTYTGPEAIERLTTEHGWEFDKVEAWLCHAMSRLLLRPPA